MSSGLQVATLGISASAFLYYATTGEFVKAIAIPVGGYGLLKVSNHYNSETTEEVAIAVMTGPLWTIPGSYVGYNIFSLGGKTFLSKVIALVVGSAITYIILRILTELVLRFFQFIASVFGAIVKGGVDSLEKNLQKP